MTKELYHNMSKSIKHLSWQKIGEDYYYAALPFGCTAVVQEYKSLYTGGIIGGDYDDFGSIKICEKEINLELAQAKIEDFINREMEKYLV